MGQNAEKIIFVARNTHKYVAKEGSRNLVCCRAPHGARGLKPYDFCRGVSRGGRAPHGARGLKLDEGGNLSELCVAPRMGRVD